MKTVQALILILGFTFTSQSFSNDFEAALSSETAQFTFRSDSSLVGWGGADLSLGLFYNEDDDFVVQAELLQARQASSDSPLTLGVGIKAYAGMLDGSDDDIFGLGIGGEIKYTFPGVMPMAVYLRGFYAPEITSFADAEKITDYVLGFQIEVLPQTTASIGIRHLEVETKNLDDYDLDDDKLHVGVRFTF